MGNGQTLRNGAERSLLSKDPAVNDHLQIIVKGSLNTIILAYLLERPRTGRELMDELRLDMGVHLSPGRVYPLLRTLEKRGLLVSQEGARQVIYRPANRAQVEELVRKKMEACEKLHDFCRRLARVR